MTDRVNTCKRCLLTRPIKGRGVCSTCYSQLRDRGQLDQYERQLSDRRNEVVPLVRAGMSTTAIAQRLGISVNAASLAISRARRSGLIDAPEAPAPSWPAEPSPCKGVDTDLFLLHGSNGGVLSGPERRKAEQALTYCARCPLATREWCVTQVDPAATRFSGIAGGVVWLSGHPRMVAEPAEAAS